MSIRKTVRENLLKAAAVSNKAYDKKEKPYDYTAPMKSAPKRHYTGGTRGTDKPVDAQHRVKYSAHGDGFVAGFVDLLEFAGLTKESAYECLEALEKQANPLMKALQNPMVSGGLGAGAGVLGTLGAQKLMGMLGGGEEEEAIQPPEDAMPMQPDMSMYGMMDPSMMGGYGQEMMMDPSMMGGYGQEMMYDPYMEQGMDGGYGQQMMVPGAWYGY